MVNGVSGIDCNQLWQISREKAQPADPYDAHDRIAICPSILGVGYKRDIELRNGIYLTFHRYRLKENWIVDCMASEENECLEWMFTLSSGFRLPTGVEINQGQHLVAGLVSTEGFWEGLGQIPAIEIDIHLEPEILLNLIGHQVDVLPRELQRMLGRDATIPFSPVRAIPPAMQIALQQMLDCPYQGVVKQMYLESKAVEVLTLWLDQVGSMDSWPQAGPKLPAAELDRIHQAKEILLQQLEQPPSLMALARQVGMNDCSLKRGFKQVYGTTVFGYLHHYRMEQARSLLIENRVSVTAIAHRVGYTNLSAFSAAFRKKYGVSPRAMQVSRRVCS